MLRKSCDHFFDWLQCWPNSHDSAACSSESYVREEGPLSYFLLLLFYFNLYKPFLGIFHLKTQESQSWKSDLDYKDFWTTNPLDLYTN